MKSKRAILAGIIVGIVVLGVSVDYLLSSGLQSGIQNKTTCIIAVESGLTIHVVNTSGRPVAGANVSLNTTYNCAATDLKGTTDVNGDAGFGVTPGIRYTVTVTPPQSYQGGKVTTWTIISAPPTAFTTETGTILKST